MPCLSADLTTHAVYNFSTCSRRFNARAHAVAPGQTGRIVTTASHILMAAATPQERAAAAVRASAAAPGKTGNIATTAARIVSVAAATPQEREAAAVPALGRGANNEQLCCCQLTASSQRQRGRPGTSSQRQRASLRWQQQRHKSGQQRRSHGAGNVQWCCCQRGLQLYQLRAAWLRYWAAQWHLARAVGRRFRGCRAKRLYLHKKKCTDTKQAPSPATANCSSAAH